MRHWRKGLGGTTYTDIVKASALIERVIQHVISLDLFWED